MELPPNTPPGFIPFNVMPKEQHLRAASKGGRSKSVKKSEGAKRRWLMVALANDKELTQEQKDRLLAKITSRQDLAASVLIDIEKYKNQIHVNQRVALLNTELAAGKFLHGEKIQMDVTSKSIVININGLEKYPQFDNDNNDSTEDINISTD